MGLPVGVAPSVTAGAASGGRAWLPLHLQGLLQALGTRHRGEGDPGGLGPDEGEGQHGHRPHAAGARLGGSGCGQGNLDGGGRRGGVFRQQELLKDKAEIKRSLLIISRDDLMTLQGCIQGGGGGGGIRLP